MTLSEFMASGDYDRHLKRLLPVLKQNAGRMTAAVQLSFPPSTGISDPRVGSVLWLELPEKVDAEQLFDQAIARQISIMPGDVFAAGKRYGNFIRISFGHPWSQSIEDGVEQLGSLVRSITG